MHVHRVEDEAFYVLDGRFSFHAGGEVLDAPRGTFVFLPKDVPHGFVCHEDPGRLLCLLAPAGGEEEFKEMGQPAAAITVGPIPEVEPDPGADGADGDQVPLRGGGASAGSWSAGVTSSNEPDMASLLEAAYAALVAEVHRQLDAAGFADIRPATERSSRPSGNAATA